MKNAEVLHEHGIHTMFADRRQVFIKLFLQFLFLKKSVDCQVQFCSVQMTVIDRLQEIILLRVLRISTRAKSPAACIDRIRPGIYRGPDPLHTAARGKNFYTAMSIRSV